MKPELTRWIAPTGIRRYDPNSTHVEIPLGQMESDGLSFTARGLYGELLSYQGVPMNPYTGALESVEETASAIAELVDHGYVIYVAEPASAK